MCFERGHRTNFFYFLRQGIPFFFGNVTKRFLTKCSHTWAGNMEVTNTTACKVFVHFPLYCEGTRQIIGGKTIFDFVHMYQSEISNSISHREPANFPEMLLNNMVMRVHGERRILVYCAEALNSDLSILPKASPSML